jgi:hypothetical protein
MLDRSTIVCGQQRRYAEHGVSRLMAFAPFYAQAGAAKSNATTTNARIPWREKLPAPRDRVCQHTTGPVEYLSVYVTGLPPNTDFDFFIIQAPTAPFGLAWYQGDLETDSHGNGSGFFIGRFSIETFIVAPGVTSAPIVFHGPFPDANKNPATPPVQLYHLGLWFNNPSDAQRAGCANTVTPGEHIAGIQVLNTAQFVSIGPLAGLP